MKFKIVINIIKRIDIYQIYIDVISILILLILSLYINVAK